MTSPGIRAHGCHFPIDHDVVPTGDNLSDSTGNGRVICDVSILCALVHLRTKPCILLRSIFFYADPRQRGPRALKADLSETRMVQGGDNRAGVDT